jgi:shikimate dehydrogenase
LEISGKTKVCCVIGDPVEHSLSPIMHNAAFDALKLDFVYLAFQVKTSEVQSAISGVRSLGIHGLNVTMPHKHSVISYLDEIDPTAKFVDAVNTIFNELGRLKGFNTDGVGALKALKENGADPNGKKLVLIGAGGAARAIAYSLAQEVEELAILNRTVEKAQGLAEVLRKQFNKRIESNSLSPNCIKEELEDADILINATSIGMHPNSDKTPVSQEWLRPDLCVMDTVYNPIETKLAKDSKRVGAKVISGVEMLIHQGAASFKIWTGQSAPVKVMREAILSRLKKGGAN